MLDSIFLVVKPPKDGDGFFTISTVRLRDWVQTVSSSHTIS